MERTLPPIKPIGTVAIPCLVLEKNRVKFIEYEDEIVIGKVLSVPCRNIDEDSTGDVWAYPVKDGGVFTSIEFIPKTGIYTTTPPSYDSKTAFRIWENITEQLEWYILGSRSDFFTSCATCCGAGYTPMQGVNADGSNNFTWRIAPTVELGQITDDSGNILSYWGLPTLDAGFNYFPYGSYNDIPFPNASATGYANTTTLLAWLNANAASVGSPSTPTLTWSIQTRSVGTGNTATTINVLVATGGTIGDILGIAVVPVSAT